MARKLNPAERRDLAQRAYRLALDRVSYSKIGCILGISRQLAATLVREEQDRIASDKGGEEEVEVLIADRERAIATLDEVIRFAWQQLKADDVNPNSTYLVGYLNAIVRAQSHIVRILGLEHLSRREEEDDSLEGLVNVLGEGDHGVL